MRSGVRVFKIEGRARGPEYVMTVVQCYKEAIQSVLDNTFTEEKKTNGTSVLPLFSIVDSGMVTIWGSNWVSGISTMALVLQSVNSMSARV